MLGLRAAWDARNRAENKFSFCADFDKGSGHTEKTNVATGGVPTTHRAVGSGGRPAPHSPVPDCTWTEGLAIGTARANAEEEEEKDSIAGQIRRAGQIQEARSLI